MSLLVQDRVPRELLAEHLFFVVLCMLCQAMSFTPWIALQFKQKLEYQLEIVGTAQGG